MKFEPTKVAFGRHETFPLRYSWLTKGLHALVNDKEVFTSENATVTLGVGKNMVNAIRYWLLAARFIKAEKDKGYLATELGQLILDKKGYDPYLEDEATIWLVHWLITSNAKMATSCFWFFNNFHKAEFQTEQALTAIKDFVKHNVSAKTSQKTIQNDLTVILRMYAGAKVSSRITLEDLLDSPLSSLNLIQRSSANSFSSMVNEQDTLPVSILGFAIHELMIERAVTEIPIEELLFSKNGFAAPGAIFRLTENALVNKLEKLVMLAPDVFVLRETGGIHQLYLIKEIESDLFLKMHYDPSYMEDVA